MVHACRCVGECVADEDHKLATVPPLTNVKSSVSKRKKTDTKVLLASDLVGGVFEELGDLEYVSNTHYWMAFNILLLLCLEHCLDLNSTCLQE